MKSALFIIGQRESGKSTLIRSLTGIGRRKKGVPWKLKSLGGAEIKALIVLSSPQELGMTEKHAPKNFPEYFEDKQEIGRENYDLIICPLELSVTNPVYDYKEYIKVSQKKGFNVRIAVISKHWDGIEENKEKIREARKFALKHNKQLSLVDASNDPNVASGKIRQQLYP